ncbi:MAG: spore coat protein CotJB [Clostridia bacterium]|nr:spore coat protein CotJB [Clostridia bacterium]
MMMKDNYGKGNNRSNGCGSCSASRNDTQGRGSCSLWGSARNDASDRRNDSGCSACGMPRTSSRTGKNCGQMNAWMRRLQELDFALQELVLYLDVYPDCRRALDKFHTLRAEREQVMKRIEMSGTPVRAIGNESHDSWDWTDNPWPWEVDFPGNGKD